MRNNVCAPYMQFDLSRYVIGVDAYFENGKPVNEEHWRYIKNIPRDIKASAKPCYITVDIIRKCFNPARNMATNMMILTSEQAFEGFCQTNKLLFKFEEGPCPKYYVSTEFVEDKIQFDYQFNIPMDEF